MFKTTAQHIKFWANRKINWVQSYCNPHDPHDTIDHPHRTMIIEALRKIQFWTAYEVGCASGANLYRILKAFPGVRVGGVDVNEEAIKTAKKFLPSNALLEVRSADDLFMNDKSVDVVLSDMTLIYFDPFRIKRVLKEMRRISRNHILLVEFHSKSFWRRQWLRWTSGYHAYDYTKLLRELGFYDVQLIKVTEKDWPGGQPQKEFAYLIKAKI